MTLLDRSAIAIGLADVILDRALRHGLAKTLSGRTAAQFVMPQDRGAVWTFIRRQAKARHRVIDSAAMFAYLPRLDPSFVTDYLTRLCRGGYLAPLGGGRYRLLRNQPQPPQLRGDGRPLVQALVREQIWRALKMSGWITPRELALEASTEKARVSEDAARRYLASLHRASVVGARPAGAGETAYSLKPGQRRSAAAPRMIRAIFICDEQARTVAGCTIIAAKEVRL
jgi:hypothetical protein